MLIILKQHLNTDITGKCGFSRTGYCAMLTSEGSFHLTTCVLSCRLSDCLDGEAETVMQLRNELREKEMKLTDIRLEALSSAHQLDQLREAMNHMQVWDWPSRYLLAVPRIRFIGTITRDASFCNSVFHYFLVEKINMTFYHCMGGLIGGDREVEGGKWSSEVGKPRQWEQGVLSSVRL